MQCRIQAILSPQEPSTEVLPPLMTVCCVVDGRCLEVQGAVSPSVCLNWCWCSWICCRCLCRSKFTLSPSPLNKQGVSPVTRIAKFLLSPASSSIPPGLAECLLALGQANLWWWLWVQCCSQECQEVVMSARLAVRRGRRVWGSDHLLPAWLPGVRSRCVPLSTCVCMFSSGSTLLPGLSRAVAGSTVGFF